MYEILAILDLDKTSNLVFCTQFDSPMRAYILNDTFVLYITSGRWREIDLRQNPYFYIYIFYSLSIIIYAIITIRNIFHFNLGVTILMTLYIYLLVISEAMPPTSEAVPLIGTY